MKYFIALFVFCYSAISVTAQNSIQIICRDSLTGELLPGINVVVENQLVGGSTDENGSVLLEGIPNGSFSISCSMIGLNTHSIAVNFPADDHQIKTILLSEEAEVLESVIVYSTRSNARIEDEPTRIEVLGLEEMNEESSLVPGGIGSILGDLAVITIQRTGTINGNDAVRMEGLDPRYTQILRDGIPLYGGFSGSFGVLDLPPLDLQQVEVIKGSNSTLYGGGAIAGLINFISRQPTDSLQTSALVNITSVQGMHASAFSSGKKDKCGFTFYNGISLNRPMANRSNGFSVIPDEQEFIVHPKLFIYPDEQDVLTVGVTITADNILSGYIDQLDRLLTADAYSEEDKIQRYTTDISYHHNLSEKKQFDIKAAVGSFTDTYANHSEDLNYSELNNYFIQETNGYAVASFTSESLHHALVAGTDITFNQLGKNNYGVYLHNDPHVTTGLFMQDDIKFTSGLLLQPGIRFDINNGFGNFLLPRLAVFYKPLKSVSVRVSAGTGYKNPANLELSEPAWQLTDVGYHLKSERSYGINADINYSAFLFDAVGMEINQAFYFTNIEHPMRLDSSNSSMYVIVNDADPVKSIGSDTYLRLNADPFEIYLGYNHTIASEQTDSVKWYISYNPQDKISAVIAFESGSFRTGIEGGYIANQFIDQNQPVPNYWIFAAMASYQIPHCLFTLNCENLSNALQQTLSPSGHLVSGSVSNPVFAPVWGPIEGRIINFSVKFDF